ncbi:secreted protein [Melampsora americana]|nr:secreted protein [Melampsora americana]
MVRTLLLQSFVLSALAALAVAQNTPNVTTGPVTGMSDAYAVPTNTSDYAGANGTAVHPSTTPGVLSADGQCWCNAPPAAPEGNMNFAGAPPAVPVAPGMPTTDTNMSPNMNTPIGLANNTDFPAAPAVPAVSAVPAVPGVPAVPTTDNSTTTDSTSGVAFLKGSSNACLLAAAAVVGISSLAA